MGGRKRLNSVVEWANDTGYTLQRSDLTAGAD
jgi:hypothetical protein